MKGVKKDSGDNSPPQIEESQEVDLNLKEILDSQPELLQKFMQKNEIDDDMKS